MSGTPYKDAHTAGYFHRYWERARDGFKRLADDCFARSQRAASVGDLERAADYRLAGEQYAAAAATFHLRRNFAFHGNRAPF
jgi:hypothetical protein